MLDFEFKLLMQSCQFLLQVKLCEVNILSNMIAPLKTIFEDDIKLMENKVTKQKKRKQLLESIMTYKPDNLKDRVEKHS
jgi:di/tricarboxylate transporter